MLKLKYLKCLTPTFICLFISFDAYFLLVLGCFLDCFLKFLVSRIHQTFAFRLGPFFLLNFLFFNETSLFTQALTLLIMTFPAMFGLL